MFSADQIRKNVAVLGWPKAIFSVCLVLLFTRILSFDQFVIAVLIACVLEFMPARTLNSKVPKPKLPSADAPKRSSLT